ncbi:transporter, major facilitator family protein [Cardiosporidium cionae]|uniref:Transporter, major facilitator family protein n=1 Tax=Cardiosporidium cionae TaxID=476202 RepID=A0ABQ7JEG8_9APIC|nr:transporter, major facilitator family protein [Cardiosporidium cionae]|eukprot:KAF8822413.1 transporter, major facilitator family protein [Cardiosporidium cionae]
MRDSICRVEASSRPPTWRKVIPLIGGFLFNLTFGSIYTFGNLSLYVTSYMRWAGDENVRIKNFSWVYTVSSLGLMIFFGGMLQEWIGIRRCAVLGAVLFSLSVTLSSWTVCSLPWFTLTFGILFGLADGLSYSCPIAAAYKWWPNKRGLVTGIVLAGTSMSALVFGPLQSLLVNPENKLPTSCPYSEFPKELYFQDHEILERVPWIFFILGIIFFVISLSSALSMGDPPIDDEIRSPFLPHNSQHETPKRPLAHNQLNVSPSQLIFHKEFWILWFILMLHGQFIIYLSLLWKIIGLSEVGISDKHLSLVGNVLISVANTSGRLAWGSFADYISVRALLR